LAGSNAGYSGTPLVAKLGIDVGVLFVRQTRELAKKFAALRDRLASNGMLWVAWPKKTSGGSATSPKV
jgi:hypothetical protein